MLGKIFHLLTVNSTKEMISTHKTQSEMQLLTVDELLCEYRVSPNISPCSNTITPTPLPILRPRNYIMS